jgi:hypothetical protein
MVMTKGIKIVAKPDGTVKIEATGFKGQTCSTDVGALRNLMGMQEGVEELKPTFFKGDQTISLNQGG